MEKPISFDIGFFCIFYFVTLRPEATSSREDMFLFSLEGDACRLGRDIRRGEGE